MGQVGTSKAINGDALLTLMLVLRTFFLEPSFVEQSKPSFVGQSKRVCVCRQLVTHYEMCRGQSAFSYFRLYQHCTCAHHLGSGLGKVWSDVCIWVARLHAEAVAL